MLKTIQQGDEIKAEILRNLRWCFRYIEPEGAEILELVSLGVSGWVCVIGHPDHGSYEWAARADSDFALNSHGQADVFYQHSDRGYGSIAAALRDGLVRMVD